MRCWGAAFLGSIGYGNTSNVGESEPPSTAGAVSVGSDLISISTGFGSCGVTPELQVFVRLGLQRPAIPAIPNIHPSATRRCSLTLQPLLSRVWPHCYVPAAFLSTLHLHLPCRLAPGQVRCWGAGSPGADGFIKRGAAGELHVDPFWLTARPIDVPVVSLGARAVAVSVGDLHTCAVTTHLRVSGCVCCAWFSRPLHPLRFLCVVFVITILIYFALARYLVHW